MRDLVEPHTSTPSTEYTPRAPTATHPRTKGTRVDTPTASPSTLHICVNVVTLSTVTREEALSRQTSQTRDGEPRYTAVHANSPSHEISIELFGGKRTCASCHPGLTNAHVLRQGLWCALSLVAELSESVIHDEGARHRDIVRRGAHAFERDAVVTSTHDTCR